MLVLDCLHVFVATEETEAVLSRVLDPEDFFSFLDLWINSNCDNNDSAPESDESWPACLFGILTTLFCCCSCDNKSGTGETPVTRCNLRFTIAGFFLYVLDMGTDISTVIYYASNGQWWHAIVTLAIVYGAVVFYTIIKWRNGHINFTGAADWLRYVASSLVNWPDVKQYGELCRLERKMFKSPAKNAHLVPEWNQRRLRVAYLKFTEGVCEACPQTMLQLYLLVPDLYGAWTWTVSRLLSVALLLSVHPHLALAGVALHLVLPGILWCITGEVPRILTGVIAMCLYTIWFFMSPFFVADSVTYRRVLHAVHFLVNTAATVVWALSTPLVSVYPALYTAIICFNAVMFAVGLVGMELHKKYWP